MEDIEQLEQAIIETTEKLLTDREILGDITQ